MPRKQRKPAWFILYFLIVFMIVALVLEGKDGLPGWANEGLGIGIVLFVFGSIALWVHLNTAALLDEEIERAKHEKYVITEYPPKQPSNKKRNGDGDDDSVSYDPFQINQVTQFHN
jgi:hypothetical protein